MGTRGVGVVTRFSIAERAVVANGAGTSEVSGKWLPSDAGKWLLGRLSRLMVLLGRLETRSGVGVWVSAMSGVGVWGD